MARTKTRGKGPKGRRGAVIALVAVAGTVLLGFAALTIDLGHLYVARAELQRAADAAALAAATACITDAGLAQYTDALGYTAWQRASDVAYKDPVLGSGMVLRTTDVVAGHHNFADPTGPLTWAQPWNAVQVTARRTTDSANGPISLFFARIWGKEQAEVVATARAALEDQLSSYNLENNQSGTGFLPFAIPEEAYYYLLAHGPDVYSFAEGCVLGGGDGIHEVKMYPWTWSGAGGILGCEGPGNFGILNIGRANEGTSNLVNQIIQGTTPAQVQAAFGTSTLTFYDETHTAETGPNIYWIDGSPGHVTEPIDTAIDNRIGQIFGCFLHRGLVETGTTTKYAISGMFFARVMMCNVNGVAAPGLVVQPVGYSDSYVGTSTTARSTGGCVGRITLVQ
jgi:hypothetical protein